MADVGERPAGHRLRKARLNEPAGPENFYWQERCSSTTTAEGRAGAANYAREWRKKNPLKVKASELRKQFGIDLATYDSMLEMQGGVCAICGGKDKNFRLAVDHCHQTGKIRGLLCSACNKAIGGFKDSPMLLIKAMRYLHKHLEHKAA